MNVKSTPEVKMLLVDTLKAGHTLKVAAAACGVTAMTVRNWKRADAGLALDIALAVRIGRLRRAQHAVAAARAAKREAAP